MCGTSTPAWIGRGKRLVRRYVVVRPVISRVAWARLRPVTSGIYRYSETVRRQPHDRKPRIAQSINVNGPATTVVSATASPDVTINMIGGNPTMLLRTATMDGMDFTASASFPGGTPQQPQFVQLVTANLITFRQSDGHSPDSSLRCTPNALSNGQQALDDAGGLSFYYPLTQNPCSSTSTTSDSPSVGLAPYTPSAAVGELLNSMSFAMYLMWDPQQPSGCTPMGTAGARTTCTSIPVPLGTLNWHWSCDGINTSQGQANGTNWTKGCTPVISAGTFTAGDAFPSWQTYLSSGTSFRANSTCQ